jgi:hypothetical protein
LWPACRRLNKRPLTVAAGAPVPRQNTGGEWTRWLSGQEEELRRELDVEGSGLKDRDGEVWYLCSAPLGCVERLPSSHSGEAAAISSQVENKEAVVQGATPLPQGWWARKVIIETMSRDQGWSSNNPKYYGQSAALFAGRTLQSVPR